MHVTEVIWIEAYESKRREAKPTASADARMMRRSPLGRTDKQTLSQTDAIRRRGTAGDPHCVLILLVHVAYLLQNLLQKNMSFPDLFSHIASDYRQFRPQYPSAIFDFIVDHCCEQRDVAIDVGCGSGQATVGLSKLFKQVKGFDPSSQQIEAAETKM